MKPPTRCKGGTNPPNESDSRPPQPVGSKPAKKGKRTKTLKWFSRLVINILNTDAYISKERYRNIITIAALSLTRRDLEDMCAVLIEKVDKQRKELKKLDDMI